MKPPLKTVIVFAGAATFFLRKFTLFGKNRRQGANFAGIVQIDYSIEQIQDLHCGTSGPVEVTAGRRFAARHRACGEICGGHCKYVCDRKRGPIERDGAVALIVGPLNIWQWQ